jgi:ribosomal protein L4
MKANDNFILALENNAKLEKPSVKKIINFLEKTKIDNTKKILFIVNNNDDNNIKLSTNNLKNITTKK